MLRHTGAFALAFELWWTACEPACEPALRDKRTTRRKAIQDPESDSRRQPAADFEVRVAVAQMRPRIILKLYYKEVRHSEPRAVAQLLQ